MPIGNTPEKSFAELVYGDLEGGISTDYVTQFYSNLSETDCTSDQIKKTAQSTINALKGIITINPEPRDKSVKQIQRDAARLSSLVNKRGTDEYGRDIIKCYVQERAGKKKRSSRHDFVNQFSKRKSY